MKYILMLLLFITTLTYSSDVFSDEITIIHGLDPILHFNRDTELNEEVNLFGVKYNKWSIYSFTNSYNKDSILVTKEIWKKNLYQRDRFSIRASSHFGLVHGYEDTKVHTVLGLHPWLFISSTFDYKLTKDLSIGLNVSIVPAFDSSVFSKNLTLTHRF